MIRELASKRLASPSRHLHADTKFLLTKRDTHSKSLENDVVASLDALKLTFEEEESEIEISGPFPLPPKSESSTTEKHDVAHQANTRPCVFFAHTKLNIQLRTSQYTPLLPSSHTTCIQQSVKWPLLPFIENAISLGTRRGERLFEPTHKRRLWKPRLEHIRDSQLCARYTSYSATWFTIQR